MLSFKRSVGFPPLVLNHQFGRYLSTRNLPDFYKELGLKSNATSKEIKSAFLSLSKKYHPDVNRDNNDCHSKFIAINEAYRTLINDESRREYDCKRSNFSNYTSHVHQYYSSHPHVHRPYMSSEAYRREYERLIREREFYPPRDDLRNKSWSGSNFRSPWGLHRMYAAVVFLFLIGHLSIRKQKKIADKYYIARDRDYVKHPDLLAITRYERRRFSGPRDN